MMEVKYVSFFILKVSFMLSFLDSFHENALHLSLPLSLSLSYFFIVAILVLILISCF